MAKKMVAFRFDKAFIEESKNRAESRNETFTDYVINCVSLVNKDSALRKKLTKSKIKI